MSTKGSENMRPTLSLPLPALLTDDTEGLGIPIYCKKLAASGKALKYYTGTFASLDRFLKYMAAVKSGMFCKLPGSTVA